MQRYLKIYSTKNAYRFFKESYEPNKFLFGFAGLRISSNGIEQKNPILPSHWRSLTIKSIRVKQEGIVVEREGRYC